ncbi:hypothetical protein GGF32_005263 [Allomyces javanicus]|nr:hypothetical protein GGF32_005263 [Allomyces javanicus]
MPPAPTPLPALLPTTTLPPTTTPGFESRRRRRPRFERIHADDRADPDALADRLALLWTKYVSDVLLHNYAVLPADVVQGLEAVELVLRGSSAATAATRCLREEAIASSGGASCCSASRLAHAPHHHHDHHADDHEDDDLASTAAVWPTLRSPRPAALALGAHSVRLTRKPSTSSSRRAAAPPGTPRPLHRAASPAISAAPMRHPAMTPDHHLPAARICRTSPAPRRSVVGGIRDAAAVAGGARLARRGGDPAYHATLRLAQLRLKHLVAAIVAPLLVKLEHMDPASRPLLRILLARHRDQIPVLLLEPVARRVRRTSLLSATESVRSSTSSWSLEEEEDEEVMPVAATLDLATSPLEKLAVLLRHEMDTAARALHAALLGARLAAPPLQASYDLVVRSVRLFAYIQRADPALKWVMSDPGTSVDARAMDTVTDPRDHARSAHDVVVLFSVGPGLVREDETGAIVAVIRRERVVIGRRHPTSCCGASLSSTTSDSWVDDETDSELTWSDRSRTSSAAPSPAPSTSSPRLRRATATPGSPGTLCLPSLRDTARTRPTSAPGGSPRLVLASLARIASVPSLRGNGDASGGAQPLRHTQSTPAMAHRTSALVHLLRGSANEMSSPATSAFGLVSPPATPPPVGSPLRGGGGGSPQIAARHRGNPSNGSSLLTGAAMVPDEVEAMGPPRRQAKVSSVCAVLDMPLE